ncbi:MAG: hypothetical protein ACXW5U_17765 [Thermoanaerobaculia bacterium]
MKDEGGRMTRSTNHQSSIQPGVIPSCASQDATIAPSSFILHPSSFILHPSDLHPSSFILHPSSFILHPSGLHPSSFILHPSDPERRA